MPHAPQPAPLADALDYPNRRVRFAALRAIMALDPQSPFPGASRVPETLGYFATSAERTPRRRGDAGRRSGHDARRASSPAWALEAEASSRGGDGRRSSPSNRPTWKSCSSTWTSMAPGIRDVLYALRSDPATGQVPIGLLATSDRLDAAERIGDRTQPRDRLPATADADAALRRIGRSDCNDLPGRDAIPPEDRAAHGRPGARLAGPASRPRPHVLRPPAPGAGRRSGALLARR